VRGAGRALLLAAVSVLILPLGAAAQVPFGEPPRALVFLVDGLSYEAALDDPVVARVALSGGIGLMTPTLSPVELSQDLRGVIDGRSALMFPTSPDGVGTAVRQAVEENAGAGRILVLIVVPEPSPAMRDRSGSITSVVMAKGRPDLVASPVLRGLTSATTRRDGLVSNVDVVPTVLDFLGRPLPPDAPGAPIRVSEETPTELLGRYVRYRDVVRPVGLSILAAALATLAAALVLLLGRWEVSPTVARSVALVGLAGISLQVALLPGSWLPDYSWSVLLPVLGLVAAVVLLAAVAVGRRSPYAAVAMVAGAGLALVVVDAVLGWPSLLTPLLGGSALEGVRFFGLGNPYAGVVLAGAVLVAALLRPWAGVAVIAAAALFAGLPWAGADLGGGVTLFAVTALWWALRVRGRVGLSGLLVVAAAAVAGGVLLIALHGLAAAPSHVTRAVEEARGVGGVLETLRDRLLLNVGATLRTPVVWPALIGVPVWLGVAWTRAGPFRPALEARPVWRDGLVALAVGGILGYLLNDTYGMASVAFIYLSLGAVYPALVSLPTPPPPSSEGRAIIEE
jgi:hypothetical protein